MTTARARHIAVRLDSGKVLIAGGAGPSSLGPSLNSAELYDPTNGHFTATGSMTTPRADHAAVVLPIGNAVLVVGGKNGGTCLSSAELYNGGTGAFAPTGSMHVARCDPTLTLLPGNKVLVAGGNNATGSLASAEIYDIASGAFSVTSSMHVKRTGHTATTIDAATGIVLIAGGDDGSDATSTAELYNAATGTFAVTGAMKAKRAYHTATLIGDSVLIAGGGHATDIGEIGWAQINTAELYNIKTGQFKLTGSMNQAREGHTATDIGSGRVLVIGGHDWDPNGAMDPSSYLATAEIYSSRTGKWTSAGHLAQGRDSHTATLLFSGKVLVCGGATEAMIHGSPSQPAIKSAELWQI